MPLSMGSLYSQQAATNAMGDPLVGGQQQLSADALTAMGFNPADFVQYNGGWATDLGGANSIMLQPRADGSGFDVIRPLDKYVSEQQGYAVQDGALAKQGDATQFRANTGTTGVEKLAMGAIAAMAGGAAMGAGSGGAAAGTGAGSTQLTPALIESAVGSAGYGASSAGAGNAMSAAALDSLYNMPQGWQQAGGVAASQALQQPAQTGSPASKQPSPTPGLGSIGGGILDYLKSNPRLALGLLGGLLGSQAGGGGSTAPGAAGPAVQWTSGLQMGIQPTAQRATPNALRAPNRFTRA